MKKEEAGSAGDRNFPKSIKIKIKPDITIIITLSIKRCWSFFFMSMSHDLFVLFHDKQKRLKEKMGKQKRKTNLA